MEIYIGIIIGAVIYYYADKYQIIKKIKKIGIVLCRSNDKYKWFSNCCKKVMKKVKGK